LSLQLILIPLPLSNILPAMFILLISLAYLEEDGVSVAISLAAGMGMLAINATVIWEILRNANWLPPWVPVDALISRLVFAAPCARPRRIRSKD